MTNIWNMDGWKVIPTNGVVKLSGELVMGGGLALQAKQRYPKLASFLGRKVKECGNNVYVAGVFKVISFPTKEHYIDNSTIELIKKSSHQLADLMDEMWDYGDDVVLMPRVGCGLGGLEWSEIKPALEQILAEQIKRGQLVFVE